MHRYVIAELPNHRTDERRTASEACGRDCDLQHVLECACVRARAYTPARKRVSLLVCMSLCVRLNKRAC